TYDHAQVISINKQTVLDRNNSTLAKRPVDVPGGASHYDVVPAVMHGSRAGDPMWFVDVSESEAANGGNSISVIRMDNVLNPTQASFTSTSVDVATYSAPANAFQRDGFAVETNDARILNAAWHGNRLVATHTVGSAGTARARWYE